MLLTIATVALLHASPRLREPKDLMAIMEKSPRTYDVNLIDTPPRQWAQQALLVAYPRPDSVLSEPVREADGSLHEAEQPADLETLLAPIEVDYEAKDFAAAERGYAAVLKKYPTNYMVTLSWGDAALFDRRPQVALERYRAAQKLNPVDHRARFYEGTALVALGKIPEALDAYAGALARRPHAEFVIEGIDARRQKLGVSVKTMPLLPQARVEPATDGYRVDIADPRWLAWGMCKAAWLGEPSVRPMEGPHRLSLDEERECLIHLLAVYLSSPDRKQKPDAQLEWLSRVQKAGLLDAFIVYELIARVNPHATLMIGEQGLAAVQKYVRTFVFEKR